jgi:hypothetical protein
MIDTILNSNLFPPAIGGGPLRPQPQFSDTSLIAQGFGIGLKYEF